MMRLVFTLVVALFFPVSATSHPGEVDDDGTHVCGSNCEKWNLKQGERHSHKPEATGPVQAYVEKVVDGDTLQVRLLGEKGARKRVRVLGIDCPESHKNRKCAADARAGMMGCDEQVPIGLAASKSAAKMLKHEVVTLHPDGPDREDRYKRLLAYVETKDGTDLGLELISGGYCQDYGWRFPHPRQKSYQAAEKKSGGPYVKSKPPAKLSRREILAPLAAADVLFKSCRSKHETDIERMPVTLKIKPDGVVRAIEFSPEQTDTATARCVAGVAEHIRFPQTQQAEDVSFSFAVSWK